MHVFFYPQKKWPIWVTSCYLIFFNYQMLNFDSVLHSGLDLSSPRGARAFPELRRYHTWPLRLNWGPENVHFGKRHFWDLNINVRIFIFLENLKNYRAQFFYVLNFPLGYLKMAKKTVQSSKNAKNDQKKLDTSRT